MTRVDALNNDIFSRRRTTVHLRPDKYAEIQARRSHFRIPTAGYSKPQFDRHPSYHKPMSFQDLSQLPSGKIQYQTQSSPPANGVYKAFQDLFSSFQKTM